MFKHLKYLYYDYFEKDEDNIKDIKQPDFDIILGDEYTNHLNEKWKEYLEEKK